MRFLLVFLVFCGPALAQPARSELDQMLTALAVAPSDELAARLETRIQQAWAKAGGPAAAMLAARGNRNMQAGAASEAVQDFDAALTLSPDFVDAIGRRAAARYQAGDVGGAFRDLEDAVRREPRNFAAWRILSGIAEAQGNPAGALAAWKKLLAVDPRTEGAAKRLRELTRKAEGEDS